MAKGNANNYMVWLETATPGTYALIKGQSNYKRSGGRKKIDNSSKDTQGYSTAFFGLNDWSGSVDIIPDLPDANGYTRLETLCLTGTAPFNIQIRKGGLTGNGTTDVVFGASVNGSLDSNDMSQDAPVKTTFQFALAAAPGTDAMAVSIMAKPGRKRGAAAIEPPAPVETPVVVNATRGEVMLTFEGVKYGMRPSWEAIETVEAGLGQALEVLAAKGNAGRLTLHEKATLAGEFIRTWGVQTSNRSAAGVNDRRLKELIAEEGSMIIGRQLGLICYMAVSGGVTATGEVKPAPTGTTSPTTPATGDAA